MIVKICANRSIYDAESCLLAGADIIGVLVGQKHNSDDFIDKKWQEILLIMLMVDVMYV